MKKHQRQKSHRLRFGKQLHEKLAESNRFAREVGASERRTTRSEVALVEDAIDHVQHAGEPQGNIESRWNLVRDPRIPDLSLGPNDPLRQCLRRGQEGVRYFFGGETAHLT